MDDRSYFSVAKRPKFEDGQSEKIIGINNSCSKNNTKLREVKSDELKISYMKIVRKCLYTFVLLVTAIRIPGVLDFIHRLEF
jgi:hypothetical protein